MRSGPPRVGVATHRSDVGRCIGANNTLGKATWRVWHCAVPQVAGEHASVQGWGPRQGGWSWRPVRWLGSWRRPGHGPWAGREGGRRSSWCGWARERCSGVLLQKLQQHMLHLLAGRCRGGHAGAGARGPGRLSQLERLWARRREGREARRALQTTRTRQPYTHTYVERHGAQCDYQGEDTAAMDPPAEGAAERRQTRAMSRRLALADSNAMRSRNRPRRHYLVAGGCGCRGRRGDSAISCLRRRWHGGRGLRSFQFQQRAEGGSEKGSDATRRCMSSTFCDISRPHSSLRAGWVGCCRQGVGL